MDSFVWRLRQRVKSNQALKLWEKTGRRPPSPEVIKQRIVLNYASSFKIDTLIETGTFVGDMVHAMKDHFQTIVSVELSEDLYNRAKRRFRAYPHIQISQGDSGDVLPQVLSNVSARCLFWLDGHYSGGFTAKGNIETPVLKEVKTILGHAIKGHVILIDDARCFDGTHDYPSLDELRGLIAVERPGYNFSVSNDVIRIHPKRVVDSDV
jgi:hypothetical protein